MNHIQGGSDAAEIRKAVALGLRDAMSDPETWEVAFKAFNDYAQSRTGKFFLGSMGVIVRKLVFMALVVGALYAIGGWHALVAFFKATN